MADENQKTLADSYSVRSSHVSKAEKTGKNEMTRRGQEVALVWRRSGVDVLFPS